MNGMEQKGEGMFLRKTLLLILLAVGASLFATPLSAQVDAEAFSEPSAVPVDEFFDEKPLVIADKYLPMTYKNLSKLYWALATLDLRDDDAIDNFLRINECDLFVKSYHNDIEWVEIRDAARAHIQKDIATFPRFFEAIIPISLGRYDPVNEEFILDESSQRRGSKKLEVITNVKSDICGSAGREIEGYPLNAILLLSRPLTLLKIPVKQELAAIYLEEAAREYENLPLDLQLHRYRRIAYLRVKLKVVQYKGLALSSDQSLRAVVFAKIDGIEIYADPELMKLMYKEDFKGRRSRRVKKKPAEAQ